MLIGFYLSAAFPSFFSVYKFSKSIKIQFNSPPAFVTQFKARKTRQNFFFPEGFLSFLPSLSFCPAIGIFRAFSCQAVLNSMGLWLLNVSQTLYHL